MWTSQIELLRRGEVWRQRHLLLECHMHTTVAPPRYDIENLELEVMAFLCWPWKGEDLVGFEIFFIVVQNFFFQLD